MKQLNTTINNNNEQPTFAMFDFISDVCEGLSELGSNIGGGLVDLGEELADICAEGAREFKDDPGKFAKDSLVEVAEVAIPTAIGVAVGTALGATSAAGKVASGIAGVVIADEVKSVVTSMTSESVTPVPGSVVYCDLAGGLEHSGIYVSRNQIVHLNGSGFGEIVSPDEFCNRLGGLNFTNTIYVSCDEDSAVGDCNAVSRALEMVGKKREYNALLDNCHQFTSGCLTGNFDNADNYLWTLKDTSKQEINATVWHKWDR